jgi:hypothetical protein
MDDGSARGRLGPVLDLRRTTNRWLFGRGPPPFIQGCYPARETRGPPPPSRRGKLYRGKAGYSASAAPIFTKLPPASPLVSMLIVRLVVISTWSAMK